MRIFQVRISYTGYEEKFLFDNLPSKEDVEEAIWDRIRSRESFPICGGIIKAAEHFEWPQVWTGATEIGKPVWFKKNNKSDTGDAYIRIRCWNVINVKKEI